MYLSRTGKFKVDLSCCANKTSFPRPGHIYVYVRKYHIIITQSLKVKKFRGLP